MRVSKEEESIVSRQERSFLGKSSENLMVLADCCPSNVDMIHSAGTSAHIEAPSIVGRETAEELPLTHHSQIAGAFQILNM